jgi:hypothetical protein
LVNDSTILPVYIDGSISENEGFAFGLFIEFGLVWAVDALKCWGVVEIRGPGYTAADFDQL